YGGLGAHGRRDQISNRFLSDEIRQLQRMGTIIPSIFLTVAAFLLNVVLSRIVALQRDQIAALKAFGYSNLAVGVHYLKLVLAVAIVGVIQGSIVGYWFGLSITKIYTRIYKFPMLYFTIPPQVALMALRCSPRSAPPLPATLQSPPRRSHATRASNGVPAHDSRTPGAAGLLLAAGADDSAAPRTPAAQGVFFVVRDGAGRDDSDPRAVLG